MLLFHIPRFTPLVFVATLLTTFPGSSGANEQTPLSVIDWLGEAARTAPVKQPLQPTFSEPSVVKTATPPAISVTPLDQTAARQIGLVPPDVTGLPTRIWQGSKIEVVQDLLESMPSLTVPAAQSLFYTVLLAEADAPQKNQSDGHALALSRAATLMRLGALDPALALIEQIGVPASPEHFDLWLDISLLTGSEDRACAVLRAAPHLTRELDTKIFCAARAQEWDNAALTYGSAQALGLLPVEELALMDRFLNPDLFEDSPPLPMPRNINPLSFRVFEAIGEPLPTRSLPVAYSVADLRDLAGWKAQLEAAERLTRAGALPDNRLLGLYTDRQPAASGGIWDRVAAVQRFDTALKTRNVLAIEKTLPIAWSAMRSADLGVTFASLFHAALTPFNLTGSAQQISTTLALLSTDYEAAARQSAPGTFTAQLAFGELSGSRPTAPLRAALFDAFTTAPARPDLIAMVQQGRLGESVLHTLALLEDGAKGDANALRTAIATLRKLGLEDIARRAALQITLLEG